MAAGDGGDHVPCGEHLYPCCCHGGVASGIELSIAEGWRRGVGDVEMIIATELPCAIGAIFFRRDFQLVALFVL